MKKIIFLIVLLIGAFHVSAQETHSTEQLFNGKDLTGWVMPGEVPGFEVKDGILMAIPPNGSDLFTTKSFGNFILRFEYLLSEVGNSGVLIRCNPDDPWGTGAEVQLLAPWTPYRDDLHCTASLYGHVAVTNRPDETTGIWHEMEIKCDRKWISISVDGITATVVNTDTVNSMQEKLLHGSIGFQSNHSKAGEYAYFRNITITSLDSDPDYVAQGFGDHDKRVRQQARNAAMDLGDRMLDELTRMLDSDTIIVQAGAKQVLFDIIAHATSPGKKTADLQKLVEGIKKNTPGLKSETSRNYCLWLVEMAESTY